LEVLVIGSIISPRNMEPDTSTSMFIMPSTLQCSSTVVRRAHLPLPWSAGTTALLVLTTPMTLA
jgi:hypothetical protein